ncbi:hypothetical protein SELMODRAFT_409662 [Selaginella moellendorffii]|uniref:Uncharacterized protein n=1 Tax=Selaginella moellendorffii TaxID=88036 RepID=D8RC16_SELML|nr:hypothetical protein SELMODRAFT_409662 [Selaginella moellendorffii]
MDKRRSLNVHLFKELQISGESLSLNVSDGWRCARHPCWSTSISMRWKHLAVRAQALVKWLTPKGPQVTVLNQSMLPNEILVVGPSSIEELDISVIARSAARNYYDVVGICAELSDLDPAQESVVAVKIYDGDSLSSAVAWGPR